MKNLAIIILAAGKSTRMKSALPKVTHPVCGRPMLEYVLDLVAGLKPEKTVVVLGFKQAEVKKILKPGIKIAVQKKLLGTADAVKAALPRLGNFSGTVLVLYGDNPLLTKESARKLLEHHVKNNLDATLLTAQSDKPEGYGRILRDRYSSICGIVEEKDADDFEKGIKEINTGIICFQAKKLAAALRQVGSRNRKKEFYLTDTIAVIYKNGGLIDNVKIVDINEALGINSRLDLAKADKIMRGRINEKLMREGVSIVDPDTAFISFNAKIGKDSVIYPFTVIESDCIIGKRCLVGPFAHLREDTRLEDDVIVGNFLEISRSRLSKKTWAKHFCYLGDSRIGRSVNIGAGAVTANFDGRHKGVTIIGDKAFIGCDTVLVAPVRIGRGAATGAGAVVVKRSRVADKAVMVGVPAKPLKKVTKSY